MAKTVYLGSTLPLERGTRGYFQTTTDSLQNEKSKFINLILTRKGERVANPNFGCDLWRLLFEQKTDDIQEIAQEYVREAVEAFMPYLVLHEISIINLETFLNDNSINLYVKYGFANNPLASDAIQLVLGNDLNNRFATSGRVISRNF